ncbi:hypothetical protein Dsin_016765 [Dipteronia sinensis]|uniref:MULE transposase domain-containing protein n=1 Tax=Dipteronia sinensis TaxID=43782 RepID=A0AAE0E5X9_9ROSI|nr:hypothetical protein Dsin_016765 [Dipteronia sinensis]
MTFEELMERVQSIVKYDPNKYYIDIQSISIVHGTACGTFIRNDDDVQFMLGEDRMIPQVCVSLIERRCGGAMDDDIPLDGNPQHHSSISGNNQMFTQRSGSYNGGNPQGPAIDFAVDVEPHFKDYFGCQYEANVQPNVEPNIEPNYDHAGDCPHGSAPDMSGSSHVPENVSLSASDNHSTWVIPGFSAYSFGQVNNTMRSREPNTLIYKEQQNPDIIIELQCMKDNKFFYFFMVLRGSIRGFQRCMCHVIAVDGSFLKGRCRGTMFVATVQDDNEQAYPIAIGYGDSVNNPFWGWFLDSLKGAIGLIDDLVFIFDRHASIKAGISSVFPYATYTIYVWHFSENIRKRFHRKDVAQIMSAAAKSYGELKYNRLLEELCNLHQNAYDYIVNAGAEKWSRVHFP